MGVNGRVRSASRKEETVENVESEFCLYVSMPLLGHGFGFCMPSICL